MSERKPGWYWVCDSQGVWEPAEFALLPEAGYSWWYRCAWYPATDDRSADEVLGCEIGPRLHPPGSELHRRLSEAEATIATYPKTVAEMDEMEMAAFKRGQASIEHYPDASPAIRTHVEQALAREVERRREAEEERDRLRALINTPEINDWLAGVTREAAHQIERWGTEHDAGKTPLDWFWLIGFLAQKAATSALSDDADKAKHHTISTAAAMLNWHRALTGTSIAMRPGIADPDVPLDRQGGSLNG